MPPKLRSDSTSTSDVSFQQLMDKLSDNRSYMEDQFQKLNSTIGTICKRLDAIETKQLDYDQALTYCGDEIADLKRELKDLKNQRQLDEAATRSQMSELQQNRNWNSQAIEGVRESLDRINHEKQYMNLIISGIPESPRENVSAIITQLASKLDVAIVESDLAVAYRTKKKNLYVKFNSQITRDKVYKARKFLQQRNITSKSLSLQEDNKIYINEVLDENQHQLFYQARKKRRELNYRYIWTYHGNIYMKRDTDSEIMKITSSADLPSN